MNTAKLDEIDNIFDTDVKGDLMESLSNLSFKTAMMAFEILARTERTMSESRQLPPIMGDFIGELKQATWTNIQPFLQDRRTAD